MDGVTASLSISGPDVASLPLVGGNERSLALARAKRKWMEGNCLCINGGSETAPNI